MQRRRDLVAPAIAELAHQPAESVLVDVHALTGEHGPDLATAIDPIVVLEDLEDRASNTSSATRRADTGRAIAERTDDGETCNTRQIGSRPNATPRCRGRGER